MIVSSPAATWRAAVLNVPAEVAMACLRVGERPRGWLDEPIPYQLTDKALRLLAPDGCRCEFPVLVDGILCIECDSLHYPSRRLIGRRR